jgi:hypothetical protein
MSCDQSARILIKQGSGVPTIPASTDHRNGDWIATDIYEGEQYMDTDTGIVYTRVGSAITQIGGGGYKRAVLVVDQTGTSAPTITELINDIGTISSSYIGVGNYTITSSSLFTVGKTEINSQYFHNNSNYVECCHKNGDSSTIILKSKDNTLTLANAILVKYIIEIKVWN